ncbi:hypothetical protein BD626DRAFT_216917 [Schizophyllum amplum]|uniref:Uncharacterized protein n=1 Tax=Schizophyllum amplum TaxID=97359 RepID=A0A550CKM7_9AGAR|nr:hypothetical protein BD626DRAFT_216917 [Auriculariopsis ampla]
MSTHTSPRIAPDLASSSSRSSSQRTDVFDDGDITFDDDGILQDDEPFRDASSPPSSPGPFVDSSPASSPSMFNNDLPDEDDEDNQQASPQVPASTRRVVDPFAASGVNGVWRPRDYEKRDYPKSQKRGRVSSETALEAKRQKLSSMPPPVGTSRPTRPVPPTIIRSRVVDPLQEAVDKAFDSSHLFVDVAENQLSALSPGPLEQLKSMVVIPQDQEVVNSRSSSRTFSKSSSFSRTSSLSGMPSHEIRILASKNAITRLPRELFDLTRLTNLDLRSNRLTHIPARISALVNLTSLSLSNNPIRYLPSELLSLNKLDKLLLFPSSTLRTMSVKDRVVGETTRFGDSSVPQLTELMLRKLLAPHGGPSDATQTQQSYMEALWTLPITDYFSADRPCPPHIRRVFANCLPRSVEASASMAGPTQPAQGPASIFMSDFAMDDGPADDFDQTRAIDTDEQYEVLRCPSPAHGACGSVFVHPLEVRFTWETKFGKAIPGGAIPVRWRGCSWGCLNFLDGDNNVEEEMWEASCESDFEEIHMVSGLGSGVGTFSDDEDA